MKTFMARLFLVFFLLAHSSLVSAQIFFRSPDLSGPPMTALDPKFDSPMPGAKPAEIDAAITWNMRAAMNIAALQCGFAQTAFVAEHYNAMLVNHSEELAGAYRTMDNYFIRAKKTPAAGKAAHDAFDTRLISRYTTVQGQLGYCDVASRLGLDLKFVPRGGLIAFAKEHLIELRKALKWVGDKQFPWFWVDARQLRLPDFAPDCFDARGNYRAECSRRFVPSY